ncbi:hypothetical protein CBR_g36844 [Chara braunii]|uniref:Uncharacterized protein n=1 Tax=Chara braunii TaxID=69332 RepID=A0A388LLN8_CHABU|nr:hypothetical protein CBR_g36844 [Chara braunii]|eukprot:GBG83229.1 hypothetical protein CBR_g36844 [Chara braunii]
MSMSAAQARTALKEVMQYAEEGIHYDDDGELELLTERVPSYFEVRVNIRASIVANGEESLRARMLLALFTEARDLRVDDSADTGAYNLRKMVTWMCTEGMSAEGDVDMTKQQQGGTYTAADFKKMLMTQARKWGMLVEDSNDEPKSGAAEILLLSRLKDIPQAPSQDFQDLPVIIANGVEYVLLDHLVDFMQNSPQDRNVIHEALHDVTEQALTGKDLVNYKSAKEASHDVMMVTTERFGEITVHPFVMNYIQDYPERCALATVKFGVCPTCTVSKDDLDVIADFTNCRRSQTLETQLAADYFNSGDNDIRCAGEARMSKLDMHKHVQDNGLWGFYRGPHGDDPELDYHLALQPDRGNRSTGMTAEAGKRPKRVDEEHLFPFTWKSRRHALSITKRDVLRLGAKQWLNDNVIDMYLQSVYDEHFPDGDNMTLHVCTSFWHPAVIVNQKVYVAKAGWQGRIKTQEEDEEENCAEETSEEVEHERMQERGEGDNSDGHHDLDAEESDPEGEEAEGEDRSDEGGEAEEGNSEDEEREIAFAENSAQCGTDEKKGGAPETSSNDKQIVERENAPLQGKMKGAL